MKTLKMMAVALVLVMSTVAWAQANNEGPIARIPFSFQMGNKVMPAGTYHLQIASNAIVLVGEDGQKAIGLTHRVQGKQSADKSSLVFLQSEGSHYLYQMWRAGRDSGIEFVVAPSVTKVAKVSKMNTVEVGD